jgi:hypothetical protein
MSKCSKRSCQFRRVQRKKPKVWGPRKHENSQNVRRSKIKKEIIYALSFPLPWEPCLQPLKHTKQRSLQESERARARERRIPMLIDTLTYRQFLFPNCPWVAHLVRNLFSPIFFTALEKLFKCVLGIERKEKQFHALIFFTNFFLYPPKNAGGSHGGTPMRGSFPKSIECGPLGFDS